jgi:hypothetical protein
MRRYVHPMHPCAEPHGIGYKFLFLESGRRLKIFRLRVRWCEQHRGSSCRGTIKVVHIVCNWIKIDNYVPKFLRWE